MRGRAARTGLGIALLLFVIGCDTVREVSLSLFSRHGVPVAPLYGTLEPPGTGPAPFATWASPGPYTLPTSLGNAIPVPTMAPTTPAPSPAPLPTSTPAPTSTPFVPLEQLRQTPTPRTTVLGHGLALPPGFKIGVYAQGLATVSYMAYSPDGVLFASLPGRGAVVAMKDSPEAHQAGEMAVFAQGLTIPTGLAFYDGYLYVAEANQVVRFAYSRGRLNSVGYADIVVPNLPAGGGYNSHAIGFGPEGKLYVAIGASCNACREVDYRRATIMRYNPDGTQEEMFSQGLRDVEDLYWYPNTHQLLATNCSRLRMGDDRPADTIEYAYAGANFGWPFCHAGDTVDPELGWPLACEGVPRPFQRLQAQTMPRGLCAYTGSQFPPEYYGDIFVALYGSWERRVPVGYEIVRLDVQDGQVVGMQDFATGWLVYGMPWGRPVDLMQALDGSLLVSDERAGAIYRIYYEL